MREWGLFNEEGCIEASFFTLTEALATAEKCYAQEDDLHIAETCPDHAEQEKEFCELCDEEA